MPILLVDVHLDLTLANAVSVGPTEHATKIGFMYLQKETSYKPPKMKLATSLAYE